MAQRADRSTLSATGPATTANRPPGRTTSTSPAPSESPDRRTRILDAARACFAESGMSGTTTKAIAQRAGVTEGLLFYYFNSKEAVFEEVVRQPIEQLVTGIGEVAGQVGTVDGRARADLSRAIHARMLEVMLETVPLFGVAVFSDLVQGRDWYTTKISPFLDAGGEAVRQTLQGSAHRGVDPALLFRALLGMSMGVAIDAILGDHNVDVRAAATEMATLVNSRPNEPSRATRQAAPKRR